ncbi:hypothetical protein SAMN05443144_10917 [Fodinibius roseus]|uniref:Uncharacterized protein n=1 Tax=Fodinibius roseus TaxID=1194090 RepID=A0A1M5BWY9_9BACT|nr:hypothetical protein [Fodinibius roseus]SHF47028.1 hypothetical protein SAMN05443144_10917 [Fodinibius roseus]
MKLLGYIISVGGLIALIYTGITYINNSESFGVFGLDIAVSKGDPVPMIISLVVLIIGLLIARITK